MNINNIKHLVAWFTELKNKGVSEKEILDVLEFDSDQYPDQKLLEQAKQIVYGHVSNSKKGE